MIKNKIYKYLSIEIIKSFLTILFAFTMIAWTVRAVNFLDLVVENGHSITTYLKFSVLNMTNIITKFIPLSFLLAVMVSILKFERQNELLILWTNGVNKLKLVNLCFCLSLLILACQLLFATFITPNSLFKSRQLIKFSDLNAITSIIKVNDFSDSFKNITFYVEKKNSNGEMENVFIRDDGNNLRNIVSEGKNSKNTTIIAKKGFLNNKNLVLMDGLIQTQDSDNKINNLSFKRTELSVNGLTPRTTIIPKMQETFTSTLISCLIDVRIKLDNFVCPKNNMNKDIIEVLSRRMGMPIYIPLVTLICSFLLISVKKKKYEFMNKYKYFTLAFFILVMGEILVRYSGFSYLSTLSYFLFPIILIPIVYLILVKKLAYEKV
jgi:lipopolysaccharide export system permease protein